MDKVSREPEPASVRIGPSYPSMQLARALITAEASDDPAVRSRAQDKVRRWTEILLGHIGGHIHTGSRTPVAGLPAWVTLEVVTGGFTTGKALSAGSLQDHELALLVELGIPAEPQADARQALNTWFLTEAGQARLHDGLLTGHYAADVPEEAALATVARLLQLGQGEAARALVEEIAPFFPLLRFYPRPTDAPQRSGTRISLETTATTAQRLNDIRPNTRILEQKESVLVWTPLYDEVVALFLETVDGIPPQAGRDASGEWVRNELGRFVLSGGWPCRCYPAEWHERARSLLARANDLRHQHALCKRPERKDDSLGLLLDLLARCVEQPQQLTGRDVGRIRLVLARYVAKRGLPSSDTAKSDRLRQVVHARTVTHREIAQQLSRRLRSLSPDEGLADIGAVVRPVDEQESQQCGVPSGTEVPASLVRKVERCVIDTVDELVKRNLITSGEVLAQVLPQITSGLKSQGVADPVLRSLYAVIYRAFRKRRSLLLLNLEKQVQLEELPWLAAINRLRQPEMSVAEVSRLALQELTLLAITSFPHVILPNKLIRELDALARGSGLTLPLTEEVAADIFMGEFSDKFAQAAHQTWPVIKGSLYACYYAIDQDFGIGESARCHKRSEQLVSAQRFSMACAQRAPSSNGGNHVARNGCVIEQQQILTTHNLAVLVAALNLQRVLVPQAGQLARACYVWVLKRLQVQADDWHTKLIHTKNAAYAWRQMVFFLSLSPAEDAEDFLPWATQELAKQREPFATKFWPALKGLEQAVRKRAPEQGNGKLFLGWTQGRHWLN